MYLQIEKLNIQYHNSLSEILPIYNTDHGVMIKAKDLHQALLIKQKYKDWIKDLLTNNYRIGYSYNDKNHTIPDHPESYDYISINKDNKEVIYLSMILTYGRLKDLDLNSSIKDEVINYLYEAEMQWLTISNHTEDVLIDNIDIISDDEKIYDEDDPEFNEVVKEITKMLNEENKEDYEEIDDYDNVSDEELLVLTNTDKENIALVKNLQELIEKKDEEIDYLNGCIERLEDKNIQLEARIKHLTAIKIDGKALLNAFAAIDVQRRQKFVFGWKAKENAKITAYIFRKKAILDAGIVVNDEDDNSKPFVEKINIDDMSKAVSVYLTALERTINNSDTFNTLFGEVLEKAKRYLNNIEFEQQQDEEIRQEESIDDNNDLIKDIEQLKTIDEDNIPF